MNGDAPVAAGQVLAGKYRVERVLGQGGMGCVVAAHHLQLDEKVALKFLLPHAVTNPDAAARFLQEARAAVKIKSEHVARVIDVGQLDNGAPYMVMEYLDGSDLSTWLARRGAMHPVEAVDFVLQACEAIAEAHAIGIVHRDLKPANLFCIQRPGAPPSIKVLDFGISKMTSPGSPAHDMTRTNTLVGSPLYMSPEQMQHSKGVDLRTDIWSLGVILYELLAGHPPFEAEAVTELAVKVFTEPAPPLRPIRPDLPPGLDQVIATCLEKDRGRRYRSVGDLALALQGYGSARAAASIERIVNVLGAAGMSRSDLPGSPASPLVGSQAASQNASRAGPRASAPGVTAPPLPTTGSAWGHTSPGTGSSSKAIVGVIAGAIMLALAAGGVVLVRHRGQAAPATAAGESPAPATASASTPMPVAKVVPQADVPNVPVAPAASPSAPSANPPAASSPHVRAPTTKPAAAIPAPRGAGPGATSAAKSTNCDPPFFIDSAGDKQYKPECL